MTENGWRYWWRKTYLHNWLCLSVLLLLQCSALRHIEESNNAILLFYPFYFISLQPRRFLSSFVSLILYLVVFLWLYFPHFFHQALSLDPRERISTHFVANPVHLGHQTSRQLSDIQKSTIPPTRPWSSCEGKVHAGWPSPCRDMKVSSGKEPEGRTTDDIESWCTRHESRKQTLGGRNSETTSLSLPSTMKTTITSSRVHGAILKHSFTNLCARICMKKWRVGLQMSFYVGCYIDTVHKKTAFRIQELQNKNEDTFVISSDLTIVYGKNYVQ